MFIFDGTDNVGFRQQSDNSLLKRPCRDVNSTANHAVTATPALSEEMFIYSGLRWIHITRRGAARRDTTEYSSTVLTCSNSH